MVAVIEYLQKSSILRAVKEAQGITTISRRAQKRTSYSQNRYNWNLRQYYEDIWCLEMQQLMQNRVRVQANRKYGEEFAYGKIYCKYVLDGDF